MASMSKNMFKNMVKQKCEECGLNYLKHHIKSKGKEMTYMHLEMRNYLSSDSLLTVQEKKEAFVIRTRMTELKINFKNKHSEYNCIICEKEDICHEETQEHIYYCKFLKANKKIFQNIYKNSTDTKEIKEITREYIEKMKQRKKFL